MLDSISNSSISNPKPCKTQHQQLCFTQFSQISNTKPFITQYQQICLYLIQIFTHLILTLNFQSQSLQNTQSTIILHSILQSSQIIPNFQCETLITNHSTNYHNRGRTCNANRRGEWWRGAAWVWRRCGRRAEEEGLRKSCRRSAPLWTCIVWVQRRLGWSSPLILRLQQFSSNSKPRSASFQHLWLSLPLFAVCFCCSECWRLTLLHLYFLCFLHGMIR